MDEDAGLAKNETIKTKGKAIRECHSRMRPICGDIKDDITLSDRIYSCNHCGYTEDCDTKAAKALLLAGNRLISSSYAECTSTPEERMSDLDTQFELWEQSSNKRESGSLSFSSCYEKVVHRVINKLEEEGYMKKCQSSTCAYLYKYNKVHCPYPMRIRCIKSGNVEHLSDTGSSAIRSLIEKDLSFFVSNSTTLEGVCKECQKR